MLAHVFSALGVLKVGWLASCTTANCIFGGISFHNASRVYFVVISFDLHISHVHMNSAMCTKVYSTDDAWKLIKVLWLYTFVCIISFNSFHAMNGCTYTFQWTRLPVSLRTNKRTNERAAGRTDELMNERINESINSFNRLNTGAKTATRCWKWLSWRRSSCWQRSWR